MTNFSMLKQNPAETRYLKYLKNCKKVKIYLNFQLLKLVTGCRQIQHGKWQPIYKIVILTYLSKT